MKLKDLQAQFQRAILEGDLSVLDLIPNGAHEDKANLLSVYQDGYALRLIEVLRADHEVLSNYLGEEAFEAMARAYLAKHPSNNPNARWVAQHVPDFLQRTEPYASDPVASDLARIEHALSTAFDSADEPVLSMADIATLAPDAWSDLRLRPHPASRRLNITSNAFEIWRAVVSEEDAPTASLVKDPVKLLVSRQGGTSKIRELGVEEAMMWDEAAKGVRFGVLCEMLATYDDPAGAALRAASYLRGWLEGELLRKPDA